MTDNTNKNIVRTIFYFLVLVITIITASATSLTEAASIGTILIIIGTILSFVPKDLGEDLVETGKNISIGGMIGWLVGMLLVAFTPSMPPFLQCFMYTLLGVFLPAISLASSLKS